MKKIKKLYIISFIISLISLSVGALFHGYRIHPENASNYNLGVKMGIIMIIIFGIFLIAGLILFLIYKRRGRNDY